jgi:hypothetical protein
MTSLRRVAANQKNALKSTGPRSEQGKLRSRRNALKHGLAGNGLVLPDEEQNEVLRRCAEWNSPLRPWDSFDCWLVERIAIYTLRLDRCALHESTLRTRRAQRAGDCWDADRRADAEELGARLGKRPELVCHQLKRTAHGCDWLIGRWEALVAVLEAGAAWDDAQRSLALDLLGIPTGLRTASSPLDPPAGADEAAHLAVLARDEVVRLRDRKAALDAKDGAEQGDAMLGLEADPGAEVRLLRRYETSCMRHLEWAMAQLRARKRGPLPPPPRPTSPSPDRDARPGPGGAEAPDSGDRPRRSPLMPPKFPDWCALDDVATPLAIVGGATTPIVPISAVAPAPPPGNRRSRREARRKARRAG